MMRNFVVRAKRAEWMLLVVLFLGTRLLWLLTAVRPTFTPDEIYQGYIASEIIHGLRSFLWDYQIDAYTGGSVLTGLVAAPFFKIFGGSLFALKCAPLVFSTVSLVVLYHFMRRHFGAFEARAGALLYIFAFPAFSEMNLMALGSHTEGILFSIGTVYFFYESLWGSDRFKAAFFFGILSGLGVWFSPLHVVTLLTCGATYGIVRQKIFGWRQIFCFGGGLALGLLPWLVYNVTHDWQGLRFFAGSFASACSGSLEKLPKNMMRILCRIFPLSFGFRNLVLNYFWSGMALGMVLLSLWKRKEYPKVTFFVLYPLILIIFLAAAVANISWTGEGPYRYRYFAPFFLFLCPLAAVLLGKFRFRYWILSFWIALGFAGQAVFWFHEPAGLAFRYPGYYIEDAERLWENASRLPWKMPKRRMPYSRLSNILREAAIQLSVNDGNFFHYAQLRPMKDRAWFYFAYGATFVPWQEPWANPPLESAQIQTVDIGNRKWFYRGLGASLLWAFPSKEVFDEKADWLLRNFPDIQRSDLLWGVGVMFHERREGKDRAWLVELSRAWDRSDQEAVLSGFDGFWSAVT